MTGTARADALRVFAETPDEGTIPLEAEVIADLLDAGLVEWDEEGLQLTAAGQDCVSGCSGEA